MRFWTPWYWKGAFCFTAQDLVNPQSELSQRYPHLYQVFRHRLESAYAARDNSAVSLCSHTTLPHGYRGRRSDTDGFQKKNELFCFNGWAERGRKATRSRMNNMCSGITDRMDVYGTAGEGSKFKPPGPLLLHIYVIANNILAFGSVFLARERDENNNQNDPENLRQFAVKVQQHHTLLGAENEGHRGPPNGPVPDNRQSLRYVPEEALIMLFLTDSDRFPTLDAVYTHDRYQAIIMSPCIDYNTERQPSQPNDYSRRFPAFTAKYLLTKDRRPLLNASEGCKIATQLFQAIRQLADMNAWHNDISVNNILVDENLDVS